VILVLISDAVIDLINSEFIVLFSVEGMSPHGPEAFAEQSIPG